MGCLPDPPHATILAHPSSPRSVRGWAVDEDSVVQQLGHLRGEDDRMRGLVLDEVEVRSLTVR